MHEDIYLRIRSCDLRVGLHNIIVRTYGMGLGLFKREKRPATLLKKRLWHRCFLVNSMKFLRTPFLQSTSGRPLLYKSISIVSYYYHFMIIQINPLQITTEWFTFSKLEDPNQLHTMHL